MSRARPDPADGVDEAFHVEGAGVEQPPSSRRALGLGIGAAMVAMLVVFAWAGAESEPGADGEAAPLAPVGDTTSTTAAPSTTSAPPTSTSVVQRVLAPGWQDLGQLSPPRYHAVLVDTGDELIVFGGGRDRFTSPNEQGFDPLWSGVAIDHASGAVRELPEAPMCETGTPTGVWTGAELVVWAVAGLVLEECPAAAAYSPSSDTWRILDDGFFREAGSQPVWTGEELVSAAAGLAYRLDDGTVRRLPSVLDSPNYTGSRVFSPPTVHWTGDEVLVLGSEGVIRLDPRSGALVDGPVPPIPARARASVWTGGELLAVNYDLQAAVFDPASGDWTAAEPMPMRFSECVPEPVAGNGLALVAWCSGIAVWDGSGDWKLMSRPVIQGDGFGDWVVGGGFLYEVGGTVLRYPLPQVVDGEALQPTFLPVGAHYLDLPAGWVVSESFAAFGVDEGTGTRDTVGVEATGPGGAGCRVSSTYQGINRYVPAPTEPAELTVARDGRRIQVGQASQGPDGLAHVVIALGSDIADAACPDLEDARLLAAHLWSPWTVDVALPPGVAGDAICDVEVRAEARAADDHTEIVVQVRLVENAACVLEESLTVSLSGGDEPGVEGSPYATEFGHRLTPEQPYTIATFAWRNWCEDRLLLAAVAVGDLQAYVPQITAPCLDPDQPSTLTPTDFHGPTDTPVLED